MFICRGFNVHMQGFQCSYAGVLMFIFRGSNMFICRGSNVHMQGF